MGMGFWSVLHRANGPVYCKDYHVILIDKSSPSTALVYDLDTTLAFPCSAVDYCQKAIRDESGIVRRYHRSEFTPCLSSHLADFGLLSA